MTEQAAATLASRSDHWEHGSQPIDLRSSLIQFDAELEQLLPVIARAFSSTRPQIAVLPWSVNRAISLLPFHLHLRWPTRIPGMPLDAVFAFAPFSGEDEIFATSPLYDPVQALETWREARVSRVPLGPASRLVTCDWERAVRRVSTEKRRVVLPGSSFMTMERISTDGMRRASSRPVLGRRASRSDFRPVVVVPSQRCLVEHASLSTEDAHLLIVNIQRAQAPKTARLIRALLQSRSDGLATVLVAASPADLLLLDQQYLASCDLHFLGESRTPPEVVAIPLGNESLIAERDFQFRLEAIARTPDVLHLIALAKNAWWAMRQAIGDEFREEVQRFEAGLEVVRAKNIDVTAFHPIHELIARRATECDPTNRMAAAIDAILAKSGRVGTLVLTRNAAAANRLREELSSRLGLTPDELDELGIAILARNDPSIRSADVVITSGFFGPRTFDTAMRVGASKIFLVLDAVEIRFASWTAGRLASVCGLSDTGRALRSIEANLQVHLIGRGDVLPLEIGFTELDGPLRFIPAATSSGQETRRVYLTFTDGSWASVPPHARFDLFAGRARIRTVAAETLAPGDSVVLLESESHAALSDQLLELLDSSSLQVDAQRRSAWIEISRALFRTNGVSVADIGRRMLERGEPVDQATIRTWLASDANDVAAPATLGRFRAFAEALGLPQTGIDQMFESIARLRRLHRRAGRILARAIRAVHVDRLDVVALRNLEVAWGFNPQRLLSGARVAVIDDVTIEG